jgi:hypothetical protein
VAGLWFSLGMPVSSTNTADSHDMIEILLKVTLNTPTLAQTTHHIFLTKSLIVDDWSNFHI